MRRWNSLVGLWVAVIIGVSSAVTLAAEEKPAADQPKPAAKEKATKKDAKPKAVRLTKPWKDISSLTEEQKTQIAEIHRKALDEIKQAKQRENDAILAVLNDQQKTEYQAMMEKQTSDRKMKKSGAAAAAAAAPDARSAKKAQ